MTNTTPLITLAGIELLDLLPHLYGEVWAPRIVLDEYQAKVPPSEPDQTGVAWLRVIDEVEIDPALPYIIQMQNQGRRFHPDLISRLLKDADE